MTHSSEENITPFLVFKTFQRRHKICALDGFFAKIVLVAQDVTAELLGRHVVALGLVRKCAFLQMHLLDELLSALC